MVQRAHEDRDYDQHQDLAVQVARSPEVVLVAALEQNGNLLYYARLLMQLRLLYCVLSIVHLFC